MARRVPAIFVSHVHAEQELATILEKALVSGFRGKVRVFASSNLKNIRSGDKWLDQLHTALEDAKIELTLCSRLSITKPWVNFEVGAAWLRNLRIIPICHSGLQVGKLPMPYCIFDGLHANQENGLKRLFSTIAGILKVSAPKVDFAALCRKVLQFECDYAVRTRLLGHAGSLIDLVEGDRVTGVWKGTAVDLPVPPYLNYATPLSYKIELDLQHQESGIGGEFRIRVITRRQNYRAFIELINVSAPYFYFKYWLALAHANHCGFMVMELNPEGGSLDGVFLTNKIHEKQIGFGKISFRRGGSPGSWGK